MRSSFGVAATAYAEYRPDYAREAVRWALETAPGPRVLDLGAGTGKLTGSLLASGVDVAGLVAVEPDSAMLAALRRGLPQVRALPGSAESIPLPDGSVDAVLAGHALHWFDPAVAGPEIDRVLAPGGVLAGLWNVLDDRLPWIAGLAEVGGPAVLGARDLRSSWPGATSALDLGPPERAEFGHPQRTTVDALVAKLATHAGVLVMSSSQREATLARVRAFLAALPEASDGVLTVPMLTAVLRVVRP